MGKEGDRYTLGKCPWFVVVGLTILPRHATYIGVIRSFPNRDPNSIPLMRGSRKRSD